MRRVTSTASAAVLGALLILAATPGATAEGQAGCSIAAARLSFVNPDQPIAVDGRCCGPEKPRRPLQPVVSLELPNVETPLAETRLAEADMIPEGQGCSTFHATLPLPPALGSLWGVELNIAVKPKGTAAELPLRMTEQILPSYALAHIGFDTDERGNSRGANFRIVPFLLSGNPPLHIKYAFAEEGIPPTGELPSALLTKWAEASDLEAPCLADGSCGFFPVRSNEVDIPLPPCKGGVLAVGVIFPGAAGDFVDAIAKKLGSPPARGSAFSAEEAWTIALVEGLLTSDPSGGRISLSDEGAVADNFMALPIAPAGPACRAGTPR